MFNHAKTLYGYTLKCLDGEIGSVKDFYFDDHYWAVRYLVAETGNWLTGRQVLISPYAVAEVDIAAQQVVTNLTRKQIEESPPLEADKPVSRQFEEQYYRYFGWPTYWNGSLMWGYTPTVIPQPLVSEETIRKNERHWDPHLRSVREVNDYLVSAVDGEIGNVADFLIDAHAWAIRYLLVNVKKRQTEKKVLVSPRWIEHISWEDTTVVAALSRKAVLQAPEYLPNHEPTHEYEVELHRHYHRPGYWDEEPVGQNYRREHG